MLDLPPPFLENSLREVGDAFARAVALAEAGAGAGNIVWVRRYDSADCAVILEPEETLAEARQVIFAGLLALADALEPQPGRISFRWPDAVLADGHLVGGGRIATSPCAEDATPDWLVFGFTLRLVAEVMSDRPLPASLAACGFADLETGPLVERFARQLAAVLDQWSETGIASVVARFSARASGQDGELATLLAAPSWLVDGEVAP